MCCRTRHIADALKPPTHLVVGDGVPGSRWGINQWHETAYSLNHFAFPSDPKEVVAPGFGGQPWVPEQAGFEIEESDVVIPLKGLKKKSSGDDDEEAGPV
ncbi:hypothetical protein DL767_010298 [Monosporascus sp. MG133]|nr:hypothetical protein DL767_010298 [Monosporascus sp. MG133]